MNDKYTRYRPRPGSAYATYSHQRVSKKIRIFWGMALFGLGFLLTVLVWFILSG
jgi:hypothetical protein